jgi:hypothetical protein
MTDLSPAALVVRDAYEAGGLPAALCAAIGQAAPSVPLNLCVRGTRHWHRVIRDGEIRLAIVAIAAELDGTPTTPDES